MKAFFYSIISLGLDNSLSALDSRRIKTINLLNLIICFFLIVGLSTSFFIGPVYPTMVNLGFFVFNLLSLYLNKIRRHAASFLIFTFNVNASIFFINQFYPAEAGSYLYYYPLIVSIVLLNNPARFDRFAIFHLLISALFFVTSITVSIPALRVSFLDEDKLKVIWYYNVCISVLVTGLLSVLLSRLIYNQKKEISFQNEDLFKTREEINQSLKEKEVLLAELHHRVKNNLAIIAGLIKLQEDATDNMEAKQVLSDSKSRIMSMAMVHRMLFENPELKSIRAGKYTESLVNEIFNSYNLREKVRVIVNAEDIILPVNKSIPLGLIINEIVTNSIKYAFKNLPTGHGEFSISLLRKSDMVALTVKDNGPGFSENFNNASDNHSLGIYLIKSLAEQIDGTVNFSNNNGACINLSFSLN